MKLIVSFVWLLIFFQASCQSPDKTSNKMKVAVWDTYVTKNDGSIMHFDIIAPKEVIDTNVIFNYGKDYLITKNQAGQPLSSKECKFCHIETLKAHWEEAIKKKGYFIIEMENCD